MRAALDDHWMLADQFETVKVVELPVKGSVPNWRAILVSHGEWFGHPFFLSKEKESGNGSGDNILIKCWLLAGKPWLLVR
jgi:hypothetical protein